MTAVRIDVLTIFPELIRHWGTVSLLGRLVASGAVDLRAHDPRDAADGVHRSVDDAPFGGGAGMVMTVGPIEATLAAESCPSPVILLTPAGRPFDQEQAIRLSRMDGFTLICGRYEGVDQRVADHLCDEELSVGDVVLNGGEAAAVVLIEAVTRLLPGSMGNAESPKDESFSDGLLEYPQYTRPADHRGWQVPDVVRSGDHGAVAAWRRAQSLHRTVLRRPDLIDKRGGLSAEEVELMKRIPAVGSAADDL